MIAEPSAPPAPLCKDCRHCMLEELMPGLSACSLTPATVNPVTGATRHVYCENERSWEGEHCGPAGKHFEEKS
jgi:hypothetical protein